MPRAAAVCAFIVMFVHVWGQCFKLLGLGPAAGAEEWFFLPTNKVHVDSMSRVHILAAGRAFAGASAGRHRRAAADVPGE